MTFSDGFYFLLIAPVFPVRSFKFMHVIEVENKYVKIVFCNITPFYEYVKIFKCADIVGG